MRFLVYLMTLFFVGTAIAQNPTILQGNYITNVFGNSNFVLNPNAQTNTANVTVSNATVTRSTTTPLVATSEFNITTSTSTGYADWSLRTFDQGMKGQNCEARFTYRGFSVGSTTAQILQGANVVAQLTLTASTDPRIASINFPCGDLSAVTKFRLQQATASLTGTNEIGAIYTGLATNMANVAQAEAVVIASRITSAQTIPDNTSTTIIFNNESLDVYGEFDTSTGIFTAKRAGYYYASAQYRTAFVSWAAGGSNYAQITLSKNNSTSVSLSYLLADAAISKSFFPQTAGGVYLAVGDTLRVIANIVRGASTDINSAVGETVFNIYRFPSSSELVVTPERQNVFGGVKLQGSGFSNFVTSGAWAKFTSASTLTRTVFGKAKVESNNDHSITIENMPVGSYYISYTGLLAVDQPGSGSTTYCRFALADTATGGWQIAGAQVVSTGDVTSVNQENDGQTIGGIYTNTSVGNRTFFLQGYRTSGAGRCYAYTDGTTGSTFSIIPLDQPSNSALYVQGPVKAAATGAAIPAGYVFEELTGTTVANFSYTASTYANAASITLQPGVYLLQGQLRMTMNTGSDSCTDSVASISATSATGDGNNLVRSFGGSFGLNTYIQLNRYITVTTSNKVWYLVGVCYGTNGTVRHVNDNNTYLKAIRLN